jgi:hypothetical protein
MTIDRTEGTGLAPSVSTAPAVIFVTAAEVR